MTINEGVSARLHKLVEGMEIQEDRFVTEIIVIIKTSNPETGSVGIAYNYDTKDWIIRRGLLTAAMELEEDVQIVPQEEVDREEDDS